MSDALSKATADLAAAWRPLIFVSFDTGAEVYKRTFGPYYWTRLTNDGNDPDVIRLKVGCTIFNMGPDSRDDEEPAREFCLAAYHSGRWFINDGTGEAGDDQEYTSMRIHQALMGQGRPE